MNKPCVWVSKQGYKQHSLLDRNLLIVSWCPSHHRCDDEKDAHIEEEDLAERVCKGRSADLQCSVLSYMHVEAEA